MFNAMLIFGDSASAAVLEQLAIESGQVRVQRSMDHLPTNYELARMLNTFDPELVFLDMSHAAPALAIIEAIKERGMSAAVVGVGERWLRQWASSPMYGIAAFLSPPFTVEGFSLAVDEAVHKVHAPRCDNLLAFLPAKAGSGCTTTVINLANAIREQGSKPLVVECDLHSGVISDLLKLNPQLGVREILRRSSTLDHSIWRAVTVQHQGIDFLLTDRSKKQPLPSWMDYYHLVQFAASQYDWILMDLPEVVNDATVEIVRRAGNVFVVTTPEVGPVALAKQRCSELRARAVPESRTDIIINRWHKSDVPPEAIEKALGYPVGATLRNDYLSVRKASLEGTFVDPDTQLGRGYRSLATRFTGEPQAEEVEVRRGFLSALSWR